MLGAGPSRPDKGKGKKRASDGDGGSSGSGSRDFAAGRSVPDQGKRKRDASKTSPPAVAGEEIESQEAKRHRMGGGGAKDESFVGKAAHQAAAFRPGLIDFVFAPKYMENRVPRLDRIDLLGEEDFKNAAPPLGEERRAQRNARGRGRGRDRGNVTNRVPTVGEIMPQELSDGDKQKIAEAVLVVFPAERDVDMNGPPCDQCQKVTHKTGHCPEPSHRCDTAVDSFCNSTFQREHALDSDKRFGKNGEVIGCQVMVDHFRDGRLVDLFIHLVLYRIHKPPLRIRRRANEWIDLLIRFADTYCGGQMPQVIVENGGLLPYTKDDVFSYKPELEKFDELGVRGMPRGELDGKTIEEIKERRKDHRMRPQVYDMYGRQHSQDKLNELSRHAVGTGPVTAAPEGNVQTGETSANVQKPEASNSALAEGLPMRGASENSGLQQMQDGYARFVASIPLPADNDEDMSDLDATATRPEYPTKSVISKAMAGLARHRPSRNFEPAPIQPRPHLEQGSVALSAGVADASTKEKARGNTIDAELSRWSDEIKFLGDIIASPWSEVAAKLESVKDLMSPEFKKVLVDFAKTLQ